MRLHLARAASTLAALTALATPVRAHVGSLGGTVESAPVPTWLVVLTGGGVIGASFLFTSLLTDHDLIRRTVARGRMLPKVGVRTAIRWLAGIAGVCVLVAVVVAGLFGPPEATRNLAILLVWPGWWAGYTMSTYLVGNSWPAVNPWRTLAVVLPSGDRTLPDRLGAWPATFGLLALVWLEVVSPVGSDPRLLAGLVVAYTAATLAGAAFYGPTTWFGQVDPVAGVFRVYGWLAPVQRIDDGLELTLPGNGLIRQAPLAPDETAFVVALLWVTTYDGLVATPGWADAVRPLVRAGVPALLVYLAALAVGFGIFLTCYRLAARYARRTADSYVTVEYIERWFAPALVPIAAGYHLAHFLGYAVTLAPALVAVLASPLAPPVFVPVAVLPAWVGSLQLLFVVVGHMAAVWVGHALAFDLFTGRLQPIRSQYPFIVVMVFYTVTSMWVVAQPFESPPFV